MQQTACDQTDPSARAQTEPRKVERDSYLKDEMNPKRVSGSYTI